MADGTVPQTRSDFYVYVIFRPDGTPCYVGKGRGRRSQHHTKFSHNRHLRAIYAQAGGNLPLIKLCEGFTNAAACETEIALIAAIGRLDLETGLLVNFTNGGEGAPGYRPSDDARAKISAAKTGKKREPYTPEHRAKLSTAQKGRKHAPHTPETRAKISAARKIRPGKPQAPEAVEKTAATHRGRKRTPETCAKISEAAKIREYRKRKQDTANDLFGYLSGLPEAA